MPPAVGNGSASRWRTWPAVVLSLLLLNVSLTFENVWPTPAITWGVALSIELALSVLLLALAPRRARWIWRGLLPAAWVVLVVGRYIDVTAPGLYGRELNLYWDSQHLGNVAAMLTGSVPWWLITLGAAAIALAVLAGYVLARIAFACLARAMEERSARRALGVLAGALVVLFTFGRVAGADAVAAAFADPVTRAFARQARFAAGMVAPDVVAPALAATPALDARLERLAGADVLLVFVESYGAVAFDAPEISMGLEASRGDLASAITGTGRHVVSAYVESPTFGGSSWLAHLSLLSGVEVRDQYAYTALMASGRDTVVKAFTRQGYRTVALMPGMRQSWPEGAFYGYDTIYGSALLAYQGPHFGWWTIPDQYALAKLDALERDRPSRAPLFVVFPTSTTHAPFGPVPPYQPDWSRVLAAEPFEAADVERAMNDEPDFMDLRPHYIRAMAYEYSALAGYLRRHARDDLVMILIGDHQPPAAVAGPDAPWSVPVHVIARDRQVAEALTAQGFRPGLLPLRPSIGSMHALVPLLLEAFSHGEH
jgi:phosphoglycerol transferase MdoB-like AlkP superfamily enzyme